MSTHFIFPLIVFAIMSCATPGPNTLMLATSGVNFGFRLSIPYSTGIIIGRILLQVSVIFFLGIFFTSFPNAQTALKIIGSLYLLYLSYKIATTKSINTQNNSSSTPLTFTQAAFYQFLNPKVWTNTTTAASVFILDNEYFYFYAFTIIGVFAVISLISNSIWVLFGIQLSKFVNSSLNLYIFNLTMGVLNAACIILIWI